MAAAEIQNTGFEVIEISQGINFFQQIKALDSLDFNNVSMIVLDIVHAIAIRDSKGLALYIKELTKKVYTVFIDAYGVQLARENTPELFCNILVSPYVGEEKINKPVMYKELLDVDYFVLDAPYRNYKNKAIRASANKVLITCGGTDPSLVSIKILKALNLEAEKHLDIKLVIGSGFSVQLYETLLSLAKCSPHDVLLMKNLSHLSVEMSWCDIAVATSGLTKYELVATGTPAILMSVDSSYNDVNKNFACLNTFIDLGVVNTVSDKKLLNTAWLLLENEVERKKLSLFGARY